MTDSVRLGLRANLPQFALLVVINFFVGGMVGLQRALVPLIGEREFRIASASLVASFIVSFGLTKAAANLVSGPLADRFGRKRVLIAGWLLGLPVSLVIIAAPRWEWIVAANVLLGLSQGLAWSMTVNMKIDLVGPARRGLALGLNEFAGYTAVGCTAWVTGLMAARYGLRPAPFYLGVGYAAAGLLLSLLAVRDTRGHVDLEAAAAPGGGKAPSFQKVFARTTWADRDLFAVSQAGLINNLNDGVVWGLLPLLLAQRGLSVSRIGLVAGAYPLIWGLGQLLTGGLSDRIGRKPLIVWGMVIQAGALAVLASRPCSDAQDDGSWRTLLIALAGAALLGIGTAMVYPTLLAAVGDAAAPTWRARALAVYRFWRDMGFVAGALGCGLIADAWGLSWAVHAAGALTLLSGLVAAGALRETAPGLSVSSSRRPPPSPST
jgi:MFS family permease